VEALKNLAFLANDLEAMIRQFHLEESHQASGAPHRQPRQASFVPARPAIA
jgi:hypothetical protein